MGIIQDMEELLKKEIKKAISSAFGDSAAKADFSVERTKDASFGDWTTNAAMVLARSLKKSPMEIAEMLSSNISCQSSVGEIFEKVEAVAPGYLNFRYKEGYLQKMVAEINEKGSSFGKSEKGKGIKVNNEFISANPTGPLHLGNGRGGFFGDCLCRVLEKAGFAVTNEYYINDAGQQVIKLGHSVLKDDEAVYGGDYIEELSKEVGTGDDVRAAGETAARKIIERYIKPSVEEKMKIRFDFWMSEKSLYTEGLVDRAIAALDKKGLTYEKEGAKWLRTTDFGDDKDRVLVKSGGEKTYFASDCGYILSKMERGFKKIVETWGADHHGYIVRFTAAARALGFTGDIRFEIVQMVRLMKEGKEVRMSKRAGNVVAIDELIDAVGHDVARFFFLMYSPDTHMNFDLGLAQERSQKNPVFYVQYAHARIASILGRAREAGISNFQPTSPAGGFPISNQEECLSLLTHEKELSLMKELSKFPELVEEIADSHAVHKLPHYAISLADAFHSFYDACRVIDEENSELTKARLMLILAVKTVLGEALDLIGVDAPEKM